MTEVVVPGVGELTEIARGRTAVVYRATRVANGESVAVKILGATLAEDSLRSRFEREAQLVVGLGAHPNVVTVYDAGLTDDGHPFLVSQLIPHRLSDLLAERGSLRWQEAVALGTEIAAALTAAHGAGVLHRDVNPRNVLMAEGDVPKLADFGLARYATPLDPDAAPDPTAFAHAAPELVQGKPIDERSDVYSLAATLYEAIAGAPAFVRPGEDTLPPILDRIVTETPPSLARHGVPSAVEAVLAAAMAKDPAARPASAVAFSQQLLSAAKRAEEAAAARAAAATAVMPRTSREDAATELMPAQRTAVMPVAGGDRTGSLERRLPVGSRRRRRQWPALIAVAAVAAALIGGLAWAVGRSGDDGESAATTRPLVPLDTADLTDDESTTVAPATTRAATTTEAETDETDETDTTDETDSTDATDATDPDSTDAPGTTDPPVTTVPGEFSIVQVTTDAGSLELHIPSDGTRTYFPYEVEVANLTEDTYCPVRGGTNEVEGPGLGAVELGGCFPDDDDEPNQFMFRAFAPGTTTFVLYMCNGQSNGGTCPGTRSVNGIEITVVADPVDE